MADITLYPPIVDTCAPVFLKTSESTCKIWFSYSPYMSTLTDEIKSHIFMQVSINDQKTNKTVLSANEWSTGIGLFEINDAPEGTKEFAAEMKYIEITDKDIKGGFTTQTIYKAQLRFLYANTLADAIELTQRGSATRSDYSEWSTVTLLKCIQEPVVYIFTLDAESETANSFSNPLAINSPLLNISGQIMFEDGESETVKTCTLGLSKINFDENNKEVDTLIESVTLNINQYNNSNSFNYKFKKMLDNGLYWLDISYVTKNGYSSLTNIRNPYQNRQCGIYLQIDVEEGQEPPLKNINIETDRNNGRITIEATVDEAISSDTIITIVRSDSNSRFEDWEEIYTYLYKAGEKIKFDDRTIESGVWYKYNFQVIDRKTAARSRFLDENKYKPTPLMMIFDDVFLTSGDRQLKIALNNEIGSLSYNLQESKTDTIGSQFPWIRRNGAIRYRSFSLGGLISYLGNNEMVLKHDCENEEPQEIIREEVQKDGTVKEVISYAIKDFKEQNLNGLFYSKEDLFLQKDILALYQSYNLENGINDYNDIMLEKVFREKVIDFLLEDRPVLFRSATEGNILIRLMDVNFSPNAQLKNYIYTFGSTAVEIDKCNFDNYSKYNIQDIGNIDLVVAELKDYQIIERTGQINNPVTGGESANGTTK